MSAAWTFVLIDLGQRPVYHKNDNSYTGGSAKGGSMSGFDDREKSEERRFAMKEEMDFRIGARRNKLLGLWAAGHLGLSGAAAEAYAKEVVVADLAEPGDEDVFRRIRADFDAKGVTQSDHQIRRTMEELRTEAEKQIKDELSKS
jgi:hypothetical protein